MRQKGRITVKVDRLDIKDNFPTHGEAYAILTDGTRFAFAWGSEYPYEYENVPREDQLAAESGVQWFETKEQAYSAQKQAIDAVTSVGN